MDEVSKITFIEAGFYDIGFEVNRQKRFIIRLEKRIIGQFELTYNRKCSYIIKAHTMCNGFFIRKIRWKCLSDSYP